MLLFTLIIILSGISLGLLIDYMFLHHRFNKLAERILSLEGMVMVARNDIRKLTPAVLQATKTVVEKDAKTGAEIVHKVLENGEKELVQVKNAAYQDWERIHKKINDDINQSLRDLDKDTQAVKRGVDIEKDKLANELAVKCGVAAKELSAEDNKIIENIVEDEKKV